MNHIELRNYQRAVEVATRETFAKTRRELFDSLWSELNTLRLAYNRTAQKWETLKGDATELKLWLSYWSTPEDAPGMVLVRGLNVSLRDNTFITAFAPADRTFPVVKMVLGADGKVTLQDSEGRNLTTDVFAKRLIDTLLYSDLPSDILARYE